MSQRRMMMNASNEKAKNLSKTLSTLLKYLKPFRIAIFFVILFAVGSTIFTIIGPKILGNATTKLVQGLIAKYSGTGSIDIDGIKHTLLILLGIYILSGILSYIQAWIMSGVTQKVTYRLREEISLKINRLPLNYYDKQTHGEVLSRITNDLHFLDYHYWHPIHDDYYFMADDVNGFDYCATFRCCGNVSC